MPTSGGTRPSKRKPRVALCDLEEQTATLLSDCFRTCDIDVRVFPKAAAEIFKEDKYEGCVVDFHNRNATAMLKAARSSPSHSRIVVYGISREATDIRKFSEFGINVVIQHPALRPDALRAIRSTRLLLVNELRRYVRIPLATALTVHGPSGTFNAMTVEISGGGMSVQLAPNKQLVKGEVRVTFALPDSAPVTLPGAVCWTSEERHRFGVRFDPLAPERELVKNWIEQYLDLK